MMKAKNHNLTHKFLGCFAATMAMAMLYGCAASAPTTPIQIPSSIEFSDSAIVLNMQESTTLSIQSETATGAVPAIDVKFTDLGTGEIDTTGKCGTSEVATDTVVLTGPNNWPNAQSRCTVCFEYDGACLPVNFEASPSITVPNGMGKAPELISSTETEPNVIVSLGLAAFAIEEDMGTLYNTDGRTKIHGIISDFDLYEHAKGTREYSYELHTCLRSLVDDSGEGTHYVKGPFVHMSSDGSTENASVVSTYDELTYISPFDPEVVYTYAELSGIASFYDCAVDVADDSSSVKKSVIVTALYIPDSETTYVYMGENTSALKSVYTTTGFMELVDIKLDDIGNAHIFFFADNYPQPDFTLYQMVCSGGTCSDPEVIASNVRDSTHDVIIYNGILYIAYTKGVDGAYDAYIMPIINDAVDTSNEIQVTDDAATFGDINTPNISIGLNSANNKLMIAFAYSYENIYDRFAKYIDISTLSDPKISNTVKINETESTSAINGGLVGIMARGEMVFAYSYDTTTETEIVYTRATVDADGNLTIVDHTKGFKASVFGSYDDVGAVMTDSGKVYGIVGKNDFYTGAVTEGMSLGVATYSSTPSATSEVTTNE